MSGVSDGQYADETTFNDSFMARNGDTDTIGKVGLLNTDVDSGPSVTNPQKYLNHLGDVVGATQDGGAADLEYASNNYIIDGDSRKEAIEVLDVALADVQDQIDVHETRLDAHDITLAAHTSQLNDHESRLDAAEITIADHETRLDAAEITISDHETRLDTAETSIADHETRLDTLETGNQTIGGNKTFSGNVTIQGDLQVDGTLTTVNSTTLEVTDANILVNNGGNDTSAEGAGLTIERTSTNAAFQFDSALASKFKLGLIGSLYEIIVSGVAQVISGVKDFVSGIKADTIDESTLNAGVTIDGTLIKDGLVDGRDISVDGSTLTSHVANTSNPHSVTKAQIGLTNVTDDAQLKRAANDLNTFTEKTTLAPDDIFIIEDSADSFNKKKVKNSNAGGGGSGGAGSKNYLGVINGINGNGNFELGTTTKWSLAHTTLSGLIPNQVSGSWTAANANLSISAVTSGKLAGSYSLQMVSTVASTPGDMLVSDAFTIDASDAAKVLTFKAFYSATSGASNLNFSGTSAASIQVYIYDVTNSAWIQPAGVYGMTQGFGVGVVTGTFQSSSNGTQYRIAFVNINASAGAFTMLMDDIAISPQTTNIGPVVTDWQSYTITTPGLGTPSNVETEWRRVGDELEIRGKFTIGSLAPALGEPRITFPSGIISADTTKIPTIQIAGEFVQDSAGVIGALLLMEPSVGYVTLGFQNSTNAGLTKLTTGNGMLNGGKIAFKARIPASGWSSNVQMSNDTDTRVVAARMDTTTGTVLNGSGVKIDFNGVFLDTHGMASTANDRMTIPVSGVYKIRSLNFLSGTTGERAVRTDVKINGATSYQVALGVKPPTTTGTSWTIFGEITLKLNAGDYAEIFGVDVAGATTVVSGSYFEIERLSGPSVIAASETVACRYTTAAGQSIASSSAVTVVFGTKTYDSHNAFNASTGEFTVPVSGTYAIKGCITFGSTAWASTNVIQLRLYKGGVHISQNTDVTETSMTRMVSIQHHDSIKLLAGDVITLKAVHFNAGSKSLSTDPTENFFAIERIGN